MTTLSHVLFAVLALGGFKPTEGECFTPHIFLVAEAPLFDPHSDLPLVSQVFIYFSGSVFMPESDAATVPLIYPGETPGQAELESFLKSARPRLLRGPVGFLVKGKTPLRPRRAASRALPP